MSLSQFTLYTSGDASAPSLTGAASSLVTLLDAVLVTGYGTQPPAGWSKPFGNSGNFGCYRNSALGSNRCLVINDNGPNVTSTFREARASGFEFLTSVSTGTGQFPDPAQSQGVSPFGFVVIRKSLTADSVARQWIILADAFTFYLFVLTGDSATNYYAFSFGDIFSMAGAVDKYRCFIAGRSSENSGSANADNLPTLSTLASASIVNFMTRSYTGNGASITVSKHGDVVKGGVSLAGALPSPNLSDNSIYISPIWVSESVNSVIRGRLRGFYQILHPILNFSDGQTFSGSGDYAGKTFKIVKTSTDGAGAVGLYVMETSATVETN